MLFNRGAERKTSNLFPALALDELKFIELTMSLFSSADAKPEADSDGIRFFFDSAEMYKREIIEVMSMSRGRMGVKGEKPIGKKLPHWK